LLAKYNTRLLRTLFIDRIDLHVERQRSKRDADLTFLTTTSKDRSSPDVVLVLVTIRVTLIK